MLKASKDKIRITGEFDNWQHSNPKFIFQWDEQTQQYAVDIPINNNINNSNSINQKQKVLQVKLLRNEVDWIIITRDKRFQVIKDNNGYMNNLVEVDDFISPSANSLTVKANSTNNACSSPRSHKHSVNLHNEGNDYINISSISELSSIEEIDLEEDLFLQELNIDELLDNANATNEPFTILNYKSMPI